MGNSFPAVPSVFLVPPLLVYLVLSGCTRGGGHIFTHADPVAEVADQAGRLRKTPEPVRSRTASENWRGLVLRNKEASVSQRLKAVNSFFNRLSHVEDSSQWGEQDYWATPAETLAMNGGDCEDVSIAKYFTLLELGIPAERLRITYVFFLPLHTPHMVLTYRQSPDCEPLVLDSLQDAAVPISKRPDLLPVYSFNSEGYWLARKEKGWKGEWLGTTDKLSRWQAVLHRMQQENTGLLPDEKSSPDHYQVLAEYF